MKTTIYTNQILSVQKTLLLTLLFFGVSFVGIYFHEIWLDESHHFLLSRDSNSFLDLYKNTRYDGHPILWNYMVHIITKLSENPFYMQLLHITISAFITYIFLKKAPFQLWFKISFLLSYFMLYEYTVISRNYNLGVLFLFLVCNLYRKRTENFTIFCLLLALCCNTHSIFTIVSSTLLLSVFLEQFFNNKKDILKRFWKGYAIFILGISIAFFQILPPSDSLFFNHIDYGNLYETLKSLMSFFKALFPIVDFTTIKYWNHFYLIEHFKTTSFVIGILVWILPLLFFNKNKYLLFFVYATLFGFVAFEIVTRRYGVRYNGLIFMTLICGLWMMKPQKKQCLLKKNLSRFNFKIILFLMLIQSFSGVLAYSLDIKHTFNNGEKVANFIKEKKLNLKHIVTISESASINAFLPKNLYNLLYEKEQGFYLWNQNPTSFFSKTDAQQVVLGFEKKQQKKLYFILRKAFESNSIEFKKEYKITLIKGFENAVKENYYLYLIQKNE